MLIIDKINKSQEKILDNGLDPIEMSKQNIKAEEVYWERSFRYNFHAG